MRKLCGGSPVARLLMVTMVAASVLLAACGGSDSGDQPKDSGKVRFGVSRAYTPTLPATVAADEGMFKAKGLDATVTNFKGGGESLEALAAGEADIINYSPAGVAQAKLKGIDVVVVAAGTRKPNGWYLMVQKDSDIRSPKDLDGKKIGISAPGSATDFFARAVAGSAGIKANFVPVGGDAMVTSLEKGNVDAVLAFPPLGYQLLEGGKGRILVDLGKQPDLLLPDVWVASGDLIKNRPEVLRKALSAMHEATAKLQSDQAFAMATIKRVNGFDDAVAEQTFRDSVKGIVPDGTFTIDDISASLKLATDAGVKDLPPATEIASTEFVPTS